jgi:hypothetical protein
MSKRSVGQLKRISAPSAARAVARMARLRLLFMRPHGAGDTRQPATVPFCGSLVFYSPIFGATTARIERAARAGRHC